MAGVVMAVFFTLSVIVIIIVIIIMMMVPEVPNERTIDVHIRRLRSKLGRLANTVRTVRGQGYRFYEHPEVVVWAAPEYTI